MATEWKREEVARRNVPKRIIWTTGFIAADWYLWSSTSLCVCLPVCLSAYLHVHFKSNKKSYLLIFGDDHPSHFLSCKTDNSPPPFPLWLFSHSNQNHPKMEGSFHSFLSHFLPHWTYTYAQKQKQKKKKNMFYKLYWIWIWPFSRRLWMVEAQKKISPMLNSRHKLDRPAPPYWVIEAVQVLWQ